MALPSAARKGTWGDPIAEAQEKCAERRRRVLAHPDIALRLTMRPLSFTTPEHWNGYIGSSEVPTISGYKPNMSPRRKALIAILRAVEKRENELAEDGEG